MQRRGGEGEEEGGGERKGERRREEERGRRERKEEEGRRKKKRKQEGGGEGAERGGGGARHATSRWQHCLGRVWGGVRQAPSQHRPTLCPGQDQGPEGHQQAWATLGERPRLPAQGLLKAGPGSEGSFLRPWFCLEDPLLTPPAPGPLHQLHSPPSGWGWEQAQADPAGEGWRGLAPASCCVRGWGSRRTALSTTPWTRAAARAPSARWTTTRPTSSWWSLGPLGRRTG